MTGKSNSALYSAAVTVGRFRVFSIELRISTHILSSLTSVPFQSQIMWVVFSSIDLGILVSVYLGLLSMDFYAGSSVNLIIYFFNIWAIIASWQGAGKWEKGKILVGFWASLGKFWGYLRQSVAQGWWFLSKFGG